MDDGISDADLADLLGPVVTEIKAPAERRHPFKEYTYEELTNAPKKVYLCGDDDRPVLLTDSLWQTMGVLKTAKTYFCLELGFCIAFGLEFHGLPRGQRRLHHCRGRHRPQFRARPGALREVRR